MAKRARGLLRAGFALVLTATAACESATESSGNSVPPLSNGGTSGALGGSGGFGGTAGSMMMQPTAGTTAGTSACGPDDLTCMMAAGSGGFGGAAGVAGMMAGSGGVGGSAGAGGSGGLDPTTPTCFEFRNHGQPIAGDTSKYPIAPGEQYVCNHYGVPWNEPVEMVSYQTLYDNTAVIHHWLLYSVPGQTAEGAFEPCIGTHLLQDAQLVGGWAVGSNDVDMPEDVGLRMPNDDRSFLLEWHFFNSSGATQEDASGIRICVLPAGVREHTAGLTWLGTENFNGPAGMPAGAVSNFGSSCPNDSGAPITIFRFWPHMHQWGRNMESVVVRAGGGTETVFSQPFDFNYQISYPASVTLMPGDSIRSTCTFHNQSFGSVAFGPSSNQEMCYQFAFSYPAGALDNGVPSLVGATNTCW